MIYILEGDLLNSDCTVIGHQANCFSTMGAGFALQLKNHYPEAYEADRKFKLPPKERMGRFSFALSNDKKRLIFNLYGQFRYGKGRKFTEYDALEESMNKMFKAVSLAEKKGFFVKLGFPHGIGAGYAGGEWKEIYKRIESVSEAYGRDVYLYKMPK